MKFLLKWRWELISPLAGVLLTFAFAPFNYPFAVYISLGFIFFAWLDCSPLQAALRGYLYGLGLFASGISWVYISIHDYGGAPAVGAGLLTLLVICFWALFPAVTAYLSVKLSKLSPHKTIWLIPFNWILIEYIRGEWFLNGFPWLQIAYTQFNHPLQGYIPLIGVYGTGFLVALSLSLLLAAQKQHIKYHTALLGFASLWGTGLYLDSNQWTHPIGDKIELALIQGNVPQDQKWLPESRMKTLRYYQQASQKNWDADVIIWPETAIPAYLSQVDEFYLQPLAIEAKNNQTTLIVSLPAKNKDNEYFNTVLALGENTGRYNKNHLLPFGEYLPLQPLSGFILDSLNIHLGTFTSGGEQQPLLIAGGHAFSTSICYEDAFGSEAIRHMPEARFLVNVTNDAWFGDSLEPHQHLQIAQMRALETGRYLARTTNTGVTAIIAPDGSITKQAPLFQQTVLRGHIFPMGGITPYAKLGDFWVILVLTITLMLLIIIRKFNYLT